MKPVTVEFVSTGYLITDKSEWRRSVKRELRFISQAGDSFESHRECAAADATKLIVDMLPGNTLGSVDVRMKTAQLIADSLFISRENAVLMGFMRLAELLQEAHEWDTRIEAETAQLNEPPVRSYREPAPQQPERASWTLRHLLTRAQTTPPSVRGMPPPLPRDSHDAVEVR